MQSESAVACCGSLLTYLRFLLFLLQLLCETLLLDSLAEAAVLQVLDSGLHHVQQPLQLCGPLRVLGRSTHVLMSVLSKDTHRKGSFSQCNKCVFLTCSGWRGLESKHASVPCRMAQLVTHDNGYFCFSIIKSWGWCQQNHSILSCCFITPLLRFC